MRLQAKLYIGFFVGGGAWAIYHAISGWHSDDLPRFLCNLVVCALVSGLKVNLPGIKGTMSVNFLFILVGVSQMSLGETMALGCVGTLVQCIWKAKNPVKPIRLLFSVSSMAIAVTGCYAFCGILPMKSTPSILLAASLVFFFLNTAPVAGVVALTENRRLAQTWRNCYFWSFPFYVVGASIDWLLCLVSHNFNWLGSLLLMPILFFVYRSYRVYLGRLEDEKRHAQEVAGLHLRTIEALALAIEAKDHATHEHLRRVRTYVEEIGRDMHLSDLELDGLRAAALLHDIGKLAVPEHILSKPGKMNAEEFEKMKIHPIVGAEILECVGFPCPVAPIVEAHHEKWDGSGYPFGLKGEEIPIGARILTAVDCLDALATDRQYRRALPLDEAMSYIAGLSGKQFDPQVVEVLKEHYLEFEADTRSAPVRETKIDRQLVIRRGDAPAAGFENSGETKPASTSAETFIGSIASARQAVQTILEITHDLSASLRLEETLSVVAERLRQLVPFDCIAVYIREGNVLAPKYVNGDNSRMFSSLSIPVGQGLSGWVVENRKPIINGNPSVEPGYLNDPSKFSLLSAALSVPLGDGAEELSGALTLYRAERDSYTRDHLRVLLAVTPKISRAIESALRLQHAQQQANTDELTALPNARGLFLHLEKEVAKAKAKTERFALLVCDLDGFKFINDRFGHLTGNELLKRVALILQNNCRDTDYVARMGGDEFVLILAGARQDDLESRIENLDRLIRWACRDLCQEELVGLSVGIASYPEHGASPEALLTYADSEMYRVKRDRKKADQALK